MSQTTSNNNVARDEGQKYRKGSLQIERRNRKTSLLPCYYLTDSGTDTLNVHISRERAAELLHAARSRRRDNVLRTALAYRILDCGLVILRGFVNRS